MNPAGDELSRLYERAFPDDAPGDDLWQTTRASVRRRVRTRRALAAVSMVVLAAVVVGIPAVLLVPRDDPDVEFVDQPPGTESPEPAYTEKPFFDDESLVDPEPGASAEPEPEPEPAPEPTTEAPVPAAPARVEIRDYKIVLLDAEGNVTRHLYGDYDPAVDGLDYGIGNLAVRPGSTMTDLAVAFVDGYMARSLSVVVVVDGGEPQLFRGLGVADHDAFGDDQPMAEPAAVWSPPNGAWLAWLQPDTANQARLHALAWSESGPTGAMTPPEGILVDPGGLLAADGTRGLSLDGWPEAGRLTARAYLPLEGGAERRYVVDITLAGGRVEKATLAHG